MFPVGGDCHAEFILSQGTFFDKLRMSGDEGLAMTFVFSPHPSEVSLNEGEVKTSLGGTISPVIQEEQHHGSAQGDADDGVGVS